MGCVRRSSNHHFRRADGARLFLTRAILVVSVFHPALALARNERLAARINNMAQEAARFHETVEPGWATMGPEQARDEERIRGKVQAVSVGSHVTFRLVNGERIDGELREVSTTEFRVATASPEDARRTGTSNLTVTRPYAFSDVEAFFEGSDPRDIPAGDRVEIRLVGGDSLRGRIGSQTSDKMTIDARWLAYDDVVGVRKLGMRGVYKWLIGTGIGIAAVLVFLKAPVPS